MESFYNLCADLADEKRNSFASPRRRIPCWGRTAHEIVTTVVTVPTTVIRRVMVPHEWREVLKMKREVLWALVILSCAGMAMGKGSGGSSSSSGGSSGGYSGSSSSYSSSYSSGKMGGSSWGESGRTSGGSRIYRQDDYYYSSGPRTYYGGTGQRGPRYYNNRAIATSAVVVAAVWASAGRGEISPLTLTIQFPPSS